MEATSRLVDADYVAAKLDVSKPTAYRIIRSLNSELVAAGARVIPGRVNLEYLETAYFTQPSRGGVKRDGGVEVG